MSRPGPAADGIARQKAVLRVHQLREALAVLGVHSDDQDVDGDAPRMRALQLAHALVQAAEIEALDAEFELQQTGQAPQEHPSVALTRMMRRSRDMVGVISEYRQRLLNWRADQLCSSLDSCQREEGGDPIFAAAADAAALTATLVAYRQSSELLMTSEEPQSLADVPDKALATAFALLNEVAATLDDLTS